jgi:hypothetical protein
MRSREDAVAGTGSVDVAVIVRPPHAAATPARMSAAPAGCRNERDMVGL